MKKVHQFLNKAAPLKGTFGIEIEAEGQDMREVHNAYWKTEDDGSLRGRFPEQRAEFVLVKPITEDKVLPALDSLKEELEGAKFDFSFRTSVHVHVNVQDLTEDQLMNMIYTYVLLEEPLVNFCGRERKGNRFCLRIVDAEWMVDILSKMFKQGIHYAMMLPENEIRYSALNIAALRKYGSLEFRSMRGNMDIPFIHKWTRALGMLKEYAITKKNPKEVLADFEKFPPKEFLKLVLKDLADDFSYPRMVKEIQRSFSLTLDLPHAYRDQEELDAPIEVAPKVRAAPARRPVQIFDEI